LKVSSSRFAGAAERAGEEPRAPGPVVVLAGRSNVGKSSLINRLLGVKGLARTSSEPGRTQCIHFYRVNESWYFVDLPGYGYAKVSLARRAAWGPMIDGFLARYRRQLALALLVVDARREPTEPDARMRDWLEAGGLPYVVAATKADKLSGNERAQAQRALAPVAGPGSVSPQPLLVSASTGLGLAELWRYLDQALEAARRARPG